MVVEDDEDNLENDGNFAKTYNSIQGKDKANRLAEINDKANKSAAKDKSKTICPHMMKGRCYHGLTGKKKHLETNTCPFLHPRVCQRVLENGLWGPRGCKERSREGHFHPRMCRASMGQHGCPTKDCKLGYHVKGRKELEAITIPGLNPKKNSQRMEDRREEVRRSWTCDKCPMMSKSENELRDHVNNVHNVSCSQCSNKFHYIEHLDRHVEQNHENWGQHNRAGGQSGHSLKDGGPGRVEQISQPAGSPTDLSAFLDRLMQMQQQQQHHTQLLQQVMGQMQLRTAGQAVMPVPGQQQVGLPLLSFQ